MNNIEEQLWNYIDGNGTLEELEATSKMIACDEAVRLKYQSLLAMNEDLASMEMEEPSMAFTYNVIETIRKNEAQVPLKAAFNRKIIMSIAIFFIISVTGFLIYAFTQVDISSAAIPDIATNIQSGIKMPQVTSQVSRPLVQGFMFFDVVLALFLFDTWLRRKKNTAQIN
ncbi:MAG TPA: hypothetical protein VHA56_00550 [Mucilaginibacter sp.]|nr:hypothetical protein [Mucilaginibacter sp.]